MKLLSPALWLAQARADHEASRAKGLWECHRRYLLQQAYEKGVKSLALACLTKSQGKDREFCSALGDCFLHHHDPVTVFSDKVDVTWSNELHAAYPKHASTLLRELKALRQQVATGIQSNADAKSVAALKKIDGTRPSRAQDRISYRYPFTERDHPNGVTPAEWKKWDHYQGEDAIVRRAIADLLDRAGWQVRVWRRQ